MSHDTKIDYLTIHGFKSIKRLDRLALGNLNVLIGTNGAGKSNLVSYFHMIRAISEGRLQKWTRKQGSTDRILHLGPKETSLIESRINFAESEYFFQLEVAVHAGFYFAYESFKSPSSGVDRWSIKGQISAESDFLKPWDEGVDDPVVRYWSQVISSWKVFHFHDTTDTAGVKRPGAVHDNEYLRPDASNLAAYLLAMRAQHPDAYQQIRRTIQLAIPFFDDFDLRPQPIACGEEQVTLLWKQRDSDYPFWPSQLSDGSIRFICLATALLQPDPPSTIIIDEPELGLHPYAITLLGGLLRSASKRMQVIVATQSVPLVNEFSVDDLIVVEREDGASVFRRHNEADLKQWLEEYSVGELWEKNLLGGRLPK